MLRIIVSPAKKMNITDEYSCVPTQPVFLPDTTELHHILTEMSWEDLKKLWQCSEKLTDQNHERLHSLTLKDAITPALLSYEGIQYQYMAPHIFSDAQWDYVSKHLRILSGFYGILKPTDKVIPYRLEMQAKLKTETTKDLYEFWGEKLYTELIKHKHLESMRSESNIQILNLASAEYSKSILPFVQSPATCVTCIFGELINGKVKVKGTQAKMARGEMVRWMAEHQIKVIKEIQDFDCLDYIFDEKRSCDTEYVFLKK